MPVPPSDPQATHVVIAALIVLGAGLCARYWGTALRLILIIVVALAIYGAVTGFEGLTSLIGHR